jgi:cell division protein YceG involved in septum cleavage
MKNNKLVLALIMGIAIGLTIGAITTYFIMKTGESKQQKEYQNEKLTITEKLTLEIKKLTLKNTVYNYIDTVENKVIALKEKDDKYVVKAGMYMLKEAGTLKQVDETTLEVLKDGATISGVDFGEELPDLDSMVYITEKGKVSEAVFYVGGFQITYDLVGTKVTEISK